MSECGDVRLVRHEYDRIARFVEARKERWSHIPLGRTGKPEDLAEAFYFLTTADSACITGQTFHVNGGLVTP